MTNFSEKEKAILVGTYSPKLQSRREFHDIDIEDTLEELRKLTAAAGGEAVESIACRLDRVNAGTFINKGKVEEIAQLVEMHDADLVIFDDQLSPRQARNLEAEFGVRTIDRRALILDIFAKRAQTREGQLQIELAQLMYILPRLTHLWSHLERQTGGIGLRGPGETQLEIDKRLIKIRMARLKKDLERVKNTRHLQREKRKRSSVPQIVLVGYTNSGKSTLFTRLTAAAAVGTDQLFATLDPTTRRLSLPNKREILMTDSVGFIRKLPHELVEAFKSTLEEVHEADLLLHVVDVSNPLWEAQKKATEQVLLELDCMSHPIIEVFNKVDLLSTEMPRLASSHRRVYISALRGDHIERLLDKIAEVLAGGYCRVRLLLPQGRGDLLAIIHREGRIIEQEFRADYVEMTVDLPSKRVEQWKRLGFVISDFVSVV